MKPLIFFAFLLGASLGVVYAQVPDPLVSPVPLVESAQTDVERMQNRRLWEKSAADNALRSGLASIAIGLYSSLLEQAPSGGDAGELELNRISAFIALGRMTQADDALQQYRGPRDSRYQLRRALVDFFLGDDQSTESLLKTISTSELQEYDRAWYYLLLGLVGKSDNNDEAEALLNRARLLAVSPEQRSQIDLIIYRSLLLDSKPLSSGDLQRLKTEMEKAVSEGRRAGYQFTKEYAIALHLVGRNSEALKVISDTLALITEANYDLRDELLLLSGVLSRDRPGRGFDAFRSLLSSGVVTEFRLRALQELVSGAETKSDIDSFLSFTSELNDKQLPKELGQRILYNRAQLLYRNADYEASNSECDTLLQGDPTVELRESALRLLVLIAYQRQRFRTASGLLIELSSLVSEPEERSQIQLLIADCFFQAGDFGDAAESYGLAIQQEGANQGAILFQWVLSEIKAGNLDAAEKHMQSFKGNLQIDPVQKWKTLWNLLTAVHASGQARPAFDLLNSWLNQNAREEMPVSLWIRLLWFRCQLSLKTGNYASTPVLAGLCRAHRCGRANRTRAGNSGGQSDTVIGRPGAGICGSRRRRT
jgi:hypothetical protein